MRGGGNLRYTMLKGGEEGRRVISPPLPSKGFGTSRTPVNVCVSACVQTLVRLRASMGPEPSPPILKRSPLWLNHSHPSISHALPSAPHPSPRRRPIVRRSRSPPSCPGTPVGRSTVSNFSSRHHMPPIRHEIGWLSQGRLAPITSFPPDQTNNK